MNIKQSYEKNKDRVLVAPGRCYSMCLDLSRKMGKIADDMFLVEGDCHYWLEDSDGNIIDIYADAHDFTYDYATMKTRKVKIVDIKNRIRKSHWVWGGKNDNQRVTVYDIGNDIINWIN